MKKEAILNQAKEMFLKHGVKTIGMDDIAQSLHISKKTIYQYFSSKEELIKQTIDYTEDIVYTSVKKIIGRCDTPIHEHFEAVKVVDSVIGVEFEKTVFLYQLKKYYPELVYHLNKKHYCFSKEFCKQNIESGIEKGLYREGVDIDFVSSQFFVGKTSFETDSVFIENFMDNFSQIDFDINLLEYHLRAIVTPKGLEILEKLLKEYE